MQITLDRHNARQKLSYCVLPHPPHFSLPSTFKVHKILAELVVYTEKNDKYVFKKIKCSNTCDESTQKHIMIVKNKLRRNSNTNQLIHQRKKIFLGSIFNEYIVSYNSCYSCSFTKRKAPEAPETTKKSPEAFPLKYTSPILYSISKSSVKTKL